MFSEKEYNQRPEVKQRKLDWFKANPDYKAVWAKNLRKLRKAVVISHYSYGFNICYCCGESILELLTIDHEKGNGNKHRREIGDSKGGNMYYWLIKNNFPKGFRVACWNCNSGAALNKGMCPHKTLISNITKL